MADENQALSWDKAVQLLDANFYFRASVGTSGRSYRASPNGPTLKIFLVGQVLEVEMPQEVASLSGNRLSSPGQSVRYAVSTVGQLLNCINMLTKNVITNVANKTMHEAERGNVSMGVKQPLNTILYGPPGTGKTYSVVLKAMSIVDATDYGLTVSSDVYQKLKQRYDALVRDGQISFVTFHQSYGYEDFIEGIRPQTEGGQISYEVRDGILKAIALTARENWQKATGASKESLDDDSLFERVWQELGDTLEESTDGKAKVRLFRGGEAELELGQTGKNVVVSLSGYKTTYPISKKQLKSLWGRRQEISRPSDTKLYNRSFFWAVLEHLKGLAAGVQPVVVQPEALKPFVLVIDEINRGNISKIFGELITLVEEDKRLGEPFEMTVSLPYSQGDEEPFGLPPNLYLVGTMNTSDRSIALLDTALRRRFEFEELQPNPSVLQGCELDVDVDLAALLNAINERVEYLYDRDHTIGHAYFVGVKTLADLERVFRRKVIPLLQEYFYEDWSKVVLVLNDTAERFIERDVRVPRGLPGNDLGIEPKLRFRVSDRPFEVEAFQNIYSD
jgi:5-methylcytosine-specific restriction enzyme B